MFSSQELVFTRGTEVVKKKKMSKKVKSFIKSQTEELLKCRTENKQLQETIAKLQHELQQKNNTQTQALQALQETIQALSQNVERLEKQHEQGQQEQEPSSAAVVQRIEQMWSKMDQL